MSNEPVISTNRISRFRFSLKQLLVAVTVLAVSVAMWSALFRKEVVVRAPGPDDLKTEFIGLRLNDMKARVVAIVSGRFAKSTLLSGWLYVVQGNIASEVCGFSVGRSLETPKSPFPQSMQMRLAFGETKTPEGIETVLGCAGHSRGQGHGNSLLRTFKTAAKILQPGTIGPGRPHIIYVEGDRSIVLNADMSIEDFAKKNPGNYLVVVVQID